MAFSANSAPAPLQLDSNGQTDLFLVSFYVKEYSSLALRLTLDCLLQWRNRVHVPSFSGNLTRPSILNLANLSRCQVRFSDICQISTDSLCAVAVNVKPRIRYVISLECTTVSVTAGYNYRRNVSRLHQLNTVLSKT